MAENGKNYPFNKADPDARRERVRPMMMVYAGPSQMANGGFLQPGSPFLAMMTKACAPNNEQEPMGEVYAGPPGPEPDDARESVGFCPNCGHSFSEKSPFCPACGSEMKWE